MVVHIYIPSTWKQRHADLCEWWPSEFQASEGYTERDLSHRRIGDIAQWQTEHLPSIHKALGLTSSTACQKCSWPFVLIWCVPTLSDSFISSIKLLCFLLQNHASCKLEQCFLFLSDLDVIYISFLPLCSFLFCILILCVRLFCLCICLCVQYPRRPEESVGSSGSYR